MNERSFGADRDWLIRFAPAVQRAALGALFSIEAEIATSLQPGLSHEVAHARLGWWQEELERLACATPRHPATRVLADDARTRTMSPPDLRGLIPHVELALASVAFLTRTELDEHCAHWALSVFRTAAGVGAAEAERLTAVAGPLVRELELLESFSLQARSGRIYTPLGDPPEDHAPWSARPLAAAQRDRLVARRAALVTALREAAAKVSPPMRPRLRVPLLWMTFAIERATRSPAQFDGHPTDAAGRLDAWRRTMLAWRAAVAISRERLPNLLL